MHSQIEIFKDSLSMNTTETLNVLKKARYMLSIACFYKETLHLTCESLLDTKDPKILIEVKKIFNMIVYLIQADKLVEVHLYVNKETDDLKPIINLFKFSGIFNKLKVHTNKIDKSILNERCVLDRKLEFIHSQRLFNNCLESE